METVCVLESPCGGAAGSRDSWSTSDSDVNEKETADVLRL